MKNTHFASWQFFLKNEKEIVAWVIMHCRVRPQCLGHRWAPAVQIALQMLHQRSELGEAFFWQKRVKLAIWCGWTRGGACLLHFTTGWLWKKNKLKAKRLREELPLPAIGVTLSFKHHCDWLITHRCSKIVRKTLLLVFAGELSVAILHKHDNCLWSSSFKKHWQGERLLFSETGMNPLVICDDATGLLRKATQYTHGIISQAVPVDASLFLSHLCRQAVLEIFCWHLAKGLARNRKEMTEKGQHIRNLLKSLPMINPSIVRSSNHAKSVAILKPRKLSDCSRSVQPAASRSVFDKQCKHECHQPLLNTSQKRSLAFTSCGFQQPISPVKEA